MVLKWDITCQRPNSPNFDFCGRSCSEEKDRFATVQLVKAAKRIRLNCHPNPRKFQESRAQSSRAERSSQALQSLTNWTAKIAVLCRSVGRSRFLPCRCVKILDATVDERRNGGGSLLDGVGILGDGELLHELIKHLDALGVLLGRHYE